MISCTEFIMAYSEWFKILDESHGPQAVDALWRSISAEFFGHLQQLVSEGGIEGMKAHWGRTLIEEKAKFEMYSDENQYMTVMHECPSVGALRRADHMTRYDRYCEHCEALYKPIIEACGFVYRKEILDAEQGVCTTVVRRLEEGRRP